MMIESKRTYSGLARMNTTACSAFTPHLPRVSYDIWIRSGFPSQLLGVTRIVSPTETSNGFSIFPVRIFGPWMSQSTATWWPYFSPRRRTVLNVSLCDSYLPCEKLRRHTSIPARIICSKTSSFDEAGPRVQTILVFHAVGGAANVRTSRLEEETRPNETPALP